ncbi:MAG TPA: hypothetical protein VHM67_15215 [Gemmatimonadaceae bacterium]|nr:hypothetical protein [Gemmatimonadaceae bacterium]
MVRQHRFAQAYGYAVCLVCVIVALISGKSAVDSAFDLARPAYAGWERDVPATFEEFRAEQRRQVDGPNGRPTTFGDARDTLNRPVPLTDEELRRIYETRRNESRARTVFRATKGLVGSLLLFVASIALFVGHWRWLRGVRDEVASA